MARSGGDYRLGTDEPVVIIELGVTSWCNYRCAYCVTEVHARRGDARHAFDHHPVDAWVAAFARVPYELSLLCRGGEPFLDHDGFAPFLTAMTALPRLRYLRVDTNGSWSPARYDAVPRPARARVQLNVSFHPTQLGLDAFARRVDAIVAAGWHVAMINYVMAPGQAADYPRVRDFFLDRHGLYVNPNPDAYDPAWTDLPRVRRAAQDPLRALLPALDLARKTGTPTAGRPCFFPSIAYFVGPDGVAARACDARLPDEPARLDFLRDSARLRPRAAPVPCPQPTCLCLDRYAFLDDAEPRGRR
ncbi:MAG: radical SAM protein, partial [Myxococcales bacterium]|nr:radical SAM protein [Myxococcales bacterium]